jgi:hypothetical protein
MTRGRKIEAAQLVARLDGSARARARLEVLLEALAGKRTKADGALALGVSERHFHALLSRLLQAALEALEPRCAGRPTRQAEQAGARVAELEGQVRELRLDVRAAQIREEIALAMPHLLQRKGGTKKAARRKVRRKPAPGSSGASAACGPSANRGRRRAEGRQGSGGPGRWSEASERMPSPSRVGPRAWG